MSERNGKVVLIADDDTDIRELVEFRLEQAGYRVLSAADGETAWSLIQEHRPDIAVLDLMMPKPDGVELTKRIRADREIAKLRIILLTASAHDVAVTRGFEAGADDYIRKPFSPQELLARIQAVLGRRA